MNKKDACYISAETPPRLELLFNQNDDRHR